MVEVMLTVEQQQLIDEAQAPVKIVDRSGREITTLLNGFVLAKLQRIREDAASFQPINSLRDLLDTNRCRTKSGWTDAEVTEALAKAHASGPGATLSEFMEQLDRKKHSA